ncbi:MAG: adenylate kinase [Candidatus Micrarchaeota archaeon]
MVNAVFLGPPGSGKGTYASRASKKLGIPHISTGDIFRDQMKKDTELGKQVTKFMEAGNLVPDDITNKIVKQRVGEPDCSNGYILDGYPRTIPQAEILEKFSPINVAVCIDIPDKIVIRRLSSRRICKKCGWICNILTLKPRYEGICDKCGGDLYQRDDDKEESIKHRLDVYMEQTAPLIEYYKNLGKLKTLKYDEVPLPEGELDAPVDLMVERVIELLKV